MSMLSSLQHQINDRAVPLAVIGLGYVGLPVACLFAKHGFRVTGIDLIAERVAEINAGISPIRGIEPGLSELVAEVIGSGAFKASTDYATIADARVILLAVDTPVHGDEHIPRYEHMTAALNSLGKVLQAGTLVIIESTIAPGTISRLVGPTLEQASGLRLGTDFWIGHCPERVMPGRLLNNLQKMDRACGGMTPEVADVMVTLYRTYVQGSLDATDPLTAELVKTGENAYRDVNIAFANDMALICEAVGGNVWKVRELLNRSPGRIMLLPGSGVGGHCIPKDPWLLRYGAMEHYGSALIPAARAVNDGMPDHIADLVAGVLTEAGVAVKGAKVAVLGYAYLENSDDTRNTPTDPLLDKLHAWQCDVRVHDPFVPAYQGDLDACIAGVDCVVIMVKHDAYTRLDLAQVGHTMRTRTLVDGRHVFSGDALKGAGFVYRIIGIGQVAG